MPDPRMNASCPDSDISIGTGDEFALMSMSQMRPPQPVTGVLLGGEDCQYAAWSECEYSCGGRSGFVCRYWFWVTGPTSVPTFAMIASGLLAWLNSAASSGICGCSAYWMPSPEVAVALSGCSVESVSYTHLRAHETPE